jgi:hypothetical protein
MKRRNFLKTSVVTLGAAGLIPPMRGEGAAPTNNKGERIADKWIQVGTGKTGLPKRKKTLNVDVAVIGGGMAGISAAVAAARNGAKTVLVQDRPVLGGNASSEMRVTVNGVHGLRGKDKPRVERETGIISTCAMMGQATGTAAAMCVKKGVNPREIGKKHISELQETIIRDDVFIPNRPAKDPRDLVRQGGRIFASTTKTGDVKLLTDGVGRDIYGETHHWESAGLPAEVQVLWREPVEISKVEIKADTDLHKKIAMHKNPGKNVGQHTSVPAEMIRTMTVDVQIRGEWRQVACVENNLTRVVKTAFKRVKTTGIRLNIRETHGHPTAKLFEIRAYES